MQRFLHSITDFFTPKPSVNIERELPVNIIETINECGEKRYIEIEKERNLHMGRQQDLEILLTKCKRLLSFVERTDDLKVFEKMATFVVKVRQAKYRGDDIGELFEEFDSIKSSLKKSYKSVKNLSTIPMG